MSRMKKFFMAVAVVLLVGLVGAAAVGFRAYRDWRTVRDFRHQIRYLIENGGTIGEAPAEQTLSTDYLDAIFGDNPDLLDKLKTVVTRGLSEEPTITLGEISALVVTYRKNGEGAIEDVVAHAVGGFPVGKRKLGFHRNGYFSGHIDGQLWEFGNAAVGFLGRDIVFFADEKISAQHQALMESFFSGDISQLLLSLEQPLYFTFVFPQPRNLVPPQLRNHIQAIIVKGMLGYNLGAVEAIALCSSARSADRAYTIGSDLRKLSDVALRLKYGGMERNTQWGPRIDPWWAYEMAKTMDEAKFTRENNLVRFKSEFGRVMVNAVIKSIERMSRDLAQMKGSLDDKLDPRQVDINLRGSGEWNYWTTNHVTGPEWPTPPPKPQTNGTPDETAASAQPNAATL